MLTKSTYYKCGCGARFYDKHPFVCPGCNTRLYPYVIAIDFDGCLCTDKFPQIGNANLDLIRRIRDYKAEGYKFILWTCRNGELLEEAVEWCKTKGLEFDAVNDCLPEWVELFGTNSRKVGADEYWDDRAFKVKAYG